MFYVYVLYSLKSQNFYVGYSQNPKARLTSHNQGRVTATKPYVPWRCVFYAGFETRKVAKDFENYLKTGSGRAFLYKHLVNSVILKKDKERYSEALA
jgi:predicted GIY-YIG superfamily endonuclease